MNNDRFVSDEEITRLAALEMRAQFAGSSANYGNERQKRRVRVSELESESQRPWPSNVYSMTESKVI